MSTSARLLEVLKNVAETDEVERKSLVGRKAAWELEFCQSRGDQDLRCNRFLDRVVV